MFSGEVAGNDSTMFQNEAQMPLFDVWLNHSD
jgi:hypothetical protein